MGGDGRKAWAMFLLESTEEKRVFLKGWSLSMCEAVAFGTESVTAVEYAKK